MTTALLLIISPHLNQTTIVTDELIAAATNYAFTVDPNEADQFFDCSHLRAPDGRTYGEILGDNAKTAIKIGKFNQDKEILPIGKLFSSSLSRDYGLQSSTDADVNTGCWWSVWWCNKCPIKKTHMAEYGYIPYTLLQITTRFKGSNANTATISIFVDQSNNAI